MTMEYKIIAIDISDAKNEHSDDILHEIQTELFKNGYRWINNENNVQSFFSNKGYLVLIDKNMYTMSKNSLEYLEKDNEVKYIGDIISYFRYLKIKKIRECNGETSYRNSCTNN